jgi:hypothetical protein
VVGMLGEVNQQEAIHNIIPEIREALQDNYRAEAIVVTEIQGHGEHRVHTRRTQHHNSLPEKTKPKEEGSHFECVGLREEQPVGFFSITSQEAPCDRDPSLFQQVPPHSHQAFFSVQYLQTHMYPYHSAAIGTRHCHYKSPKTPNDQHQYVLCRSPYSMWKSVLSTTTMTMEHNSAKLHFCNVAHKLQISQPLPNHETQLKKAEVQEKSYSSQAHRKSPPKKQTKKVTPILRAQTHSQDAQSSTM